MQQGSLNRMAKDGASTAENLFFFPDYARKRSNTKTKGKGWEQSLELLGRLGCIFLSLWMPNLLPVHKRLQK